MLCTAITHRIWAQRSSRLCIHEPITCQRVAVPVLADCWPWWSHLPGFHATDAWRWLHAVCVLYAGLRWPIGGVYHWLLRWCLMLLLRDHDVLAMTDMDHIWWAQCCQARHWHAIRPVCHLISTDLTQTLACSLILSRFDYCRALAWCSSIQKLERFRSIAGFAARIVLQAPRWSDSRPQLRQLHWLLFW